MGFSSIHPGSLPTGDDLDPEGRVHQEPGFSASLRLLSAIFSSSALQKVEPSVLPAFRRRLTV